MSVIHYTRSFPTFVTMLFLFSVQRSYAERVRGEAAKKWLQQIVQAGETSATNMGAIYTASSRLSTRSDALNVLLHTSVPQCRSNWWVLLHLSGHIITARKRSLQRLCFYTCLFVHGGVVSKHALQVSRPTPRGEVDGSGLRVSRPTPTGEVEGSGQGGLEAHIRGSLQAHTSGRLRVLASWDLQAHTWRGAPGSHPGGSPGPHPRGVSRHALRQTTTPP